MPEIGKFIIDCPPECSLHPDKIGQGKADLLLLLKENGAGANVFARRGSEVLGHELVRSTVSRHLRHYKLAADEPEKAAVDALPDGKRIADLEILDAIIASGYRNSKNWKPSIKDTLDAMKLKVQMTGNSAFDDLLQLFDDADVGDDGEEGGVEAEEAVLSPDERLDEIDDDLPEPLV